MLVYSHIWDALLKLISVVAIIVLVITLSLAERLEMAGLATPSVSEITVIVGAVLVWLFVYRQYLSIVSAWLYARMSLRTRVSLAEAKALRKLFQLDLSGTWVPLREIRKLPNDQRHGTLVLALDRFGPQRKAMLL